MATRTTRRTSCARLLVGTLLVGIVVSQTKDARAMGIDQLQQRISAGQSQVSDLSGQVSTASNRLAVLTSSITNLQTQVTAIQSRLDTSRAQLLQLRTQLDAVALDRVVNVRPIDGGKGALLQTPTEQQAQLNAGTWSRLFNRDDLVNQLSLPV